MTSTVNSSKRPSLFLVVIGVLVVLLLVGIAAVVVTNVNRQQDRESLAQLEKKQLTTLVEEKDKLLPLVNEYFAAFKKSYLADGSIEKAEQAAEPERKAFAKAEAQARSSIAKVKSSRGANHEEVKVAVAQFEDSFVGFVDYAAGLVESYPLYTSLWGTDDSPCQGIFIGDKAADLTERDELLSAAVDACREATKKLAASKNSSLAEYAQRIDNRVSLLKTDSATTAKAEQSLADYTKQYNEFQKKYDRAIATNASEKKLFALADEIELVNEEISANQSAFDFASQRYLTTVREMPDLLGDVFATHVPAEIEYYDSVIGFRMTVLEKVVADALVE